MSTVEDRLSLLEAAMQDVKRLLATDREPRAWLDDVSGSMRDWPEFDEVLRLGREYRSGLCDSDNVDNGGI